MAEGLRSFEGVPHRLERVRERDHVLYVNDSKATNVASALAGIGAFEGGVHVILGGSVKGESFEPLAGAVAERCVGAYLIGEAADELERDLAPAREAGVELIRSGTLQRAVVDAAERARAGEVVLLSPACASFDAFAGFEQRGERFRELVEAPKAAESLPRRTAPPIEYSLLLTATLCLLALGAGDGVQRQLGDLAAGRGRRRRRRVPEADADLRRDRPAGDAGGLGPRGGGGAGDDPALVAAALILLVAVMLPGVGQTVTARSAGSAPGWSSSPSELAKVALVLYEAHLLASRPKRIRSLEGLGPLLLMAGLALALIALQPDLGTP